MNIKRFFATMLPAAMVACISCAACGNKGKSDGERPDDTADSIPATGSAAFVTDSIAWTDSIVSPGKNKAVCSISVAYPVAGGCQLVDSVRRWIADQLNITPGISDQPAAPAAADSDLSDGRKLVASSGSEILNNFKPDLNEFDELGFNEPRTLEYSAIVSPLWVTPETVTFGCSTYVYLGGAHGGAGFTPAVFSRANGEQFGWNMFPESSRPQLTDMVKEGLMRQYFEVSTTADFRDALLINPDTLPLPATPPYLMPDGVHFDYQQYEIAPYAAGMPSCVLPYDSVRPLMTATAAALLPKND